MRFFHFFKKPAAARDDFFGDLCFVDRKDASGTYYETMKFFAPTQRAIGVLIQAGTDGPTEAQRLYFAHLQRNYEEYTRVMEPLIETAFQNLKKGYRITDFKKEFTLFSLTVPPLKTVPPVWDMVFATVYDEGRFVTIDFKGNEPTGIWIEW